MIATSVTEKQNGGGWERGPDSLLRVCIKLVQGDLEEDGREGRIPCSESVLS